jgi:hypothetical protein
LPPDNFRELASGYFSNACLTARQKCDTNYSITDTPSLQNAVIPVGAHKWLYSPLKRG